MTRSTVAGTWWSGASGIILLSFGAAGCGGTNFSIAGDAGPALDAGATDAVIRSDVASPDGPRPGHEDGDLDDAGSGHDAGKGHDARASSDGPIRPKDASSGDVRTTTDGPRMIDATHPVDAPLHVDSGKKPDGAAVLTQPVDLKTAANYVVLAETGISVVPSASFNGNIAVSPAAATYITGITLTLDVTGSFATAPQVTGEVFAASYKTPTPTLLTVAVGDMESAFGDASGRVPDFTDIGSGNLGAMTLGPGVYGWSSAVVVGGNLTLSGGADDIWIFQIAQTLTLDMGTNVVLTGGALPANVFWQVSGAVVFDGGAHLEGVLLADTSVALAASASVKGRVLAQTAVTVAGGVTIQP